MGENHEQVSDSHDGGPDWLKPTESPFGSEDILSKEVSQSQDTHANTPEWMHDHEEKEVAQNTISVPEPVSTTHDVPDWLQENHAPVEKASTPVVTPAETPATPEPVADEGHHDVPDWLKGAETTVETQPAVKETSLF